VQACQGTAVRRDGLASPSICPAWRPPSG
jgi:hypothetical protein